MKAFRILVLIVIFASILVSLSHFNSSADGTDNGLHIFIKEDGSAIPEPRAGLDSPGFSIRVEAQYIEDPVFETRSEKQWVDVGTWIVPDRAFPFHFNNITMNFFYQIHQEGYDAEADLEITVTFGDMWHSYAATYRDPGDEEIYLEEAFISYEPEIEMAPDDTFTIEIRYRAYEDCTFHFDNLTYDTGITIGADFLRPQNLTAEDDEIIVEVFDPFDTDWETVVDLWNISIDNETVEFTSSELESAGTTIINGTEVNVTRVTWTIEEPLVHGTFIEVFMTYHLNQYDFLHGMTINLTVESDDLIRPIAEISSISPSPADVGEAVTFDASGSSDEDGMISTFRWSSNLYGELFKGGKEVYFSDSLSIGTHTISLDVQDNDGLWSDEALATLKVREMTNEAPVITLLTPDNGSILETDSVLLEWEGEDDDGDDLTYTLYFGTDDPPVEEFLEDSDSMELELFDLEDGMTYYWMVEVSDGTNTTESEIWNFTIDLPDPVGTNSPPEVMLLSPLNGSALQTTDVTLVWRGDDDDRKDDLTYTVLFGTDPALLQPVAIDLTVTYFQITGLIEGHEYHWKVEVSDGKETIVSESHTFLLEESGDDGNGDDDDDFIPGIELIGLIIAVVVSAQIVSRGPSRRRDIP